MYHIGQPRWGYNKSLWDKAIYIGAVLTLWGWEIGVEGRLVNTAEIAAAACGSQEKLEDTVPMKEKIVVKKKKIECSEILIRMAHFYHIALYFESNQSCLVAVLINKSGLQDDDLVKKNVSVCQVYFVFWHIDSFDWKVVGVLQYLI